MKKLMLVTGLLLALGSCTSVKVDKANVNFDKYRTYAWMDADVKAGQNPLYYNDIATQNVEKTVNGTLSTKGLKQNESNPDLLVGYHFFVEQKTRTVNDPSPFYGPYAGWGRWGYQGWGPTWWGGYTSHQEKYNAGTLVVDLIDAKTHKLVWRGSVEDAVNNPNRINTELSQQVNKILEKYPDRS